MNAEKRLYNALNKVDLWNNNNAETILNAENIADFPPDFESPRYKKYYIKAFSNAFNQYVSEHVKAAQNAKRTIYGK